MEKAEKLIQKFLQKWEIMPADYSLRIINEKEASIQSVEEPVEEKLKNIIECGPSFGFEIKFIKSEEGRTGYELSFAWNDLNQTQTAMQSLGMTKEEFAISSE